MKNKKWTAIITSDGKIGIYHSDNITGIGRVLENHNCMFVKRCETRNSSKEAIKHKLTTHNIVIDDSKIFPKGMDRLIDLKNVDYCNISNSVFDNYICV